MLNPASAGPPAYTFVSSSQGRWPAAGTLTASIGTMDQQKVPTASPTPVGILASSSVMAAAVSGGVLGRPSSVKAAGGEKIVVGAK